MFVVNKRAIWFTLSGLLIALSIFGMFKFKFNLSIDFKGGTITEVKYTTPRPDQTALQSDLQAMNIGGFSLRPSGSDQYVIETEELTQAQNDELKTILGKNNANYTIEEQNSIGPTAGAELKRKAEIAVSVVVIMIVLFVTFAFRRVSKPVSSWKYGFATIIALAHDVIIPTGVFVFLGHFLGVEIDLLFVTGLLAILGYSVHDTIVVFDRVRENLRINYDRNQKEEFDQTVGKSVTQTFGRSINTSLTIFITLLALYLVGSPSTKDFALLLIIGVIVGTYSSIFIASPLLVTFYKLQKKNK